MQTNTQVVILAAGRGTRMGKLTKETPKPLLAVLNKTLLEYKFLNFPEEISEAIIVIGYKGELIKKNFGEKFGRIKIKYVEQKKLNGTAGALWAAKDFLKNRFLVMMGDDFYSKADIINCLKHPWALLVQRTPFEKIGAVVDFDKEGRVKTIKEKTLAKAGDFLNAGMYFLGGEIFNYPLVSIGNEEFGLPQTISLAAKDFPLKIIEATGWFPITDEKDLKEASKFLKNR